MKLNTVENTDTLCLCYLDEIDETLKEVDESTYFAVYPLGVTHKRLYLIGDLIYKGTIKVTANLPVISNGDYSISLRLGKEYVGVEDFEDEDNTDQGSYNELTIKYSNAIPVDILISSNKILESHTTINFVLEWEQPV